MAGPQLVVPILNARFLLNAANARLGEPLRCPLRHRCARCAPRHAPAVIDEARGAAVIARGREFLDTAFPLASGNWADLTDREGITLDRPDAIYRRD